MTSPEVSASSSQQQGWHLDRRVPVTIILALVLQTMGGVWWGARLDARVESNTARLAAAEALLTNQIAERSAMVERLARIEERANAQVDLLREIARRLQALEERQ